MTPKPILLLGVGNILLGDEGVGIHTVRRLQEEGLPEGVTALDGGTGGFHLLSWLQDYPTVVMVDATMDGKPEGTVSVVRPRFASDFPKALSAHDIGLRDLVESAQLLGNLPRIFLVTISVAELQAMEMELSPGVAAALPEAASRVREILASLSDE